MIGYVIYLYNLGNMTEKILFVYLLFQIARLMTYIIKLMFGYFVLTHNAYDIGYNYAYWVNRNTHKALETIAIKRYFDFVFKIHEDLLFYGIVNLVLFIVAMIGGQNIKIILSSTYGVTSALFILFAILSNKKLKSIEAAIHGDGDYVWELTHQNFNLGVSNRIKKTNKFNNEVASFTGAGFLEKSDKNS